MGSVIAPGCALPWIDSTRTQSASPGEGIHTVIISIRRPTTRRRTLRHIGIVVAALSMLASASAAMSATVTKTALSAGVPGFPTQPGGLGVFEADTPFPPPDARREVGTYAVTVAADPAIAAEAPFAGSWKAYAVTDVRDHTDNGVPSPMELQLAADAWAGEFLADVPAKLTWLLRHSETLIAAEADTQRAAAATQILVWQTLRNPQGGLLPRADLVTPSTDPAVNALAAKFAALMEAGVAVAAGEAALGITAGPVSGCASTLTVSATPGVPVVLTVDNGGVLTTTTVIIGATGTASAAVHGVVGTTVTVTAALASGGVLVRADGAHDPDIHTTEDNDSRTPEEMIFLVGGQAATATVAINCPALPATPSTTTPPAAPVVTAVGAPAAVLRLTKAAPSSAVAGKHVTYRLRVRNVGAVPATSVVLRDVLPSGMTIARLPAGTTLKSGVITWRLGTLAPGTQRVLALTVRLDATIAGRRCNNAAASADNAPTVRARACSQVRAVAGVSRLPVVTG